MAQAFIGRRDAIGIGKEATPGTAVAPTAWLRQSTLTFDQKTDDTDNTTALGRVEGTDEALITEQWTEGSINGPVTDTTIGLLLLNIFGSEAVAAKSAPNTAVYDHTFTVLQTANPPSLTFARSNPNASRRHSLGFQSDFELDVKQSDYAMFTSTVVARIGAASSETVAYNSTEGRFTSKHVNVYTAANVAGLGSPDHAAGQERQAQDLAQAGPLHAPRRHRPRHLRSRGLQCHWDPGPALRRHFARGARAH